MDLIERLRGMGAYASTFGRAEKLVASGSVLSCNVEAGAIASAVYLSGLVRSSHPGAGYRVRVSLDTAEGDVLDYSCECPVDGSGRGMCRHEMALALRYLVGRPSCVAGPSVRSLLHPVDDLVHRATGLGAHAVRRVVHTKLRQHRDAPVIGVVQAASHKQLL